MSDSNIEEVTSKLAKARIDGPIVITACCWNIMGEAKVEYRKKVTTETFTEEFTNSSGKTTLGQADICIQEMNFDPSHSKAKNTFPLSVIICLLQKRRKEVLAPEMPYSAKKKSSNWCQILQN